VAWVTVVVWVSHLFPDVTLVTRVNHMTPRQLLAWWTERVIKSSIAAPWKDARPAAVGHRQGAIDRAGVPRDHPDFAIIGVCPQWPAITTGGCREMHLPGIFFHKIYNNLRGLDTKFEVRVWPALDQTQLCYSLTFGATPEELPPPSDTVQPLPGMRLPDSFRDAFFHLPPEQLSYAAVKAQTLRLKMTARGVMTLYIKEDVERAVQLLAYLEDNPPVAHELLGTDRVKLLIWDLREYLNNIGRLTLQLRAVHGCEASPGRKSPDPAASDGYHQQKSRCRAGVPPPRRTGRTPQPRITRHQSFLCAGSYEPRPTRPTASW
jgi:hypothetical protein